MRLGWYLHRLRRMSAAEVLARVQVTAWQRYWANSHRRPNGLRTLHRGRRTATVALRRDDAPSGTSAASLAIAAADRLLAGEWPIFHLDHAAIGAPDWFRDPLTGIAAPRDRYAFTVSYRDENQVGNIKFVWELSRHQATTVLASAWWLSGNPAYAERVADHLISWWRDNPFLTGVHWTSAIEVGLRLLSWAWIRALLADWPGVSALFDQNDIFAEQVYYHQLYISKFRSRGSSANNHLIAELAGLSAATTAFPWFQETPNWAERARTGLIEQASAQTCPDGFNREQACEYHLFVLEMLAATTLLARLANQPFPKEMDLVMFRMADALAASLDATSRPPRFGDGDHGRGVLLDAPDVDQTSVVLDAARSLYQAQPWWPPPGNSVLGHVAHLLAEPKPIARNLARPAHFADIGMTILRAGEAAKEIWVRCDAGPHGFLSIAAHGHADALSVELRYGGVEILADPGIYCYHGEPAWREYFKGTLGHNTLTIDGLDQAVSGGPFLWLTQPHSTLNTGVATAPAPLQSWEASHDGYQRLPDPVTHHRRVTLHGSARQVEIRDWVDSASPHDVALAFHLGPQVEVQLEAASALLRWPGAHAVLHLPPTLDWRVHRGEQNPPLGWYSNGLGHKIPTSTMVGRGRLTKAAILLTSLDFIDNEHQGPTS